MLETELVASPEKFRQGDIIQIVHSHRDASHTGNLGIVINADCDLEHCKLDGSVSFLPVYDFRTYFCVFWLPDYFQARQRELLKSLQSLCGSTEEECNTLVDWIKADGWSAVSRKLCAEFSLKSSAVDAKLKELSLITQSKVHDEKLVGSICEEIGQPPSSTVKKLGNLALRNLGDGGFFINEIVGLQEVGYVVRLKRVQSMALGSLYHSVADHACNADLNLESAYRIARLTERYRFKVAQLFASQFSRIGLPDDITDLNNFAVEAALEGLVSQ